MTVNFVNVSIRNLGLLFLQFQIARACRGLLLGFQKQNTGTMLAGSHFKIMRIYNCFRNQLFASFVLLYFKKALNGSLVVGSYASPCFRKVAHS